MTEWTKTLAIAAFIFASGKFIDTYHNRSKITRATTELIREVLVRLFIFLDEVKPIQIAKYFLNLPWRYQFLLYVPPLWMAFTVGSIVIFLVFLFLGVSIPLDWVYILSIPLLIIQTVITLLLRKIAIHASDSIITIVLALMPLLIFSLTWLIPNPAKNIPNLPGLALALVWYLTIFTACLIISVFYLFFLAVLILKYVTLLLRYLAMMAIDAATDPKSEPFTYFGALFALIVMSAELISTLLK